MMATKLDRIEKDIQKTKSKIAEFQKQLRALETPKPEQENLPAHPAFGRAEP
ncbi:DUF4315 family protein [Enterococcus faecium]|nr:DUF4315 family protein [Enterococcus faecium]